jgi:hypothetical protein
MSRSGRGQDASELRSTLERCLDQFATDWRLYVKKFLKD